MHFDDETFDRLIAEAIDSLPDEFRDKMQNISIDVQPLPDEQTCREMELNSPYELLALYRGVPLTDRHVDSPFSWPDSIVIYKQSVESAARTPRQAVRQIRKTVLHEIGHFFGLDEEDLDELGYR
jgi:predicted Zn-dependent protease with MMP-like domain